ncbi:MAG: TonB-dependent receptor [Caulobacterales bacterium]|nr:TonB-dependent receptor [Caulobacterales bacterium]
MRKFGYMAGGSALAMAVSLGMASAAAAQSTEPTQVDTVIITGSLIAGTPEDAALPVDVIGAEELAKQGSPTTVELLKGLSVSNGVLGDTNQFDARAQGSEGSGSVNLRGLGPTRTLVLMNGKRMPINPFALAGSGAVDTNIIPSAAIGRVEVLKDGAAATYGSDAIAGVVNFITRTNFEGLELGASYKLVDGSDGDYTLSMTYGWQGDRSNILISAGMQHQSELPVTEREWSSLDYLENPEGGWSAAGNPATFISNSTGVRYRDDQCASDGGFAGFSGLTPVCYWQYNQFDNLVEKTDRFQLYGEFNADLTDTTKLHIEGLFSSTDVPEWKTSPSYALLATPTAAGSGIPGLYFVPAANPGLQAYVAAHPGGIPGFTSAGVATTITPAQAATGAYYVAGRPYALGGNPMFGYGASQGSRNFEAYRLAADLSGEWENGINWDFSVSYGEERGHRTGYDTVVNRFALALRGLGGANCNGIVAGSVGSTCEWFNPFSSAVPGNAITGVGGSTFNPAIANSEALTRWFFQKLETEQTSGLFVVEGLFSGKLGWELPGGDAMWALGAQYRRASFTANYNDLANRAINPCLDTPITGAVVCATGQGQGPFAFLGVGSNSDLKQEVKSVFAEVVLPFSDNFNATIAARYESYDGAVGSTFDPKLSVRWQVVDGFALRGSVGTTFRAPPPVSLNSDFVTSLQSVNGTFRAIDIYGNPNLEPETAMTYSVGGIFEVGNFKATVDYWNFDFQDPITTDPVGGMVATLFSNGIGAGALLNCSALYDRFTFSGAAMTCAARNAVPGSPAATASAAVTRVRTETVNGSGVKTSGVDVIADYTFDDFMGGSLTIGGTATYVIEYLTEATDVAGVTVAPAFDAVGLLNYQTTAYPLPQKKGNVYLEYNTGPHNLRLTVRYIDGYTDQRVSIFCTAVSATCPTVPYKTTAGVAIGQANGKQIDAFVTTDLTYRVFLPWDATATVSVDNMFDEDPPFARLDLNYDPFTASGLGRTWKVSLTKKF